MKVAYFLRDNGACGYYRMSLPLKAMAVRHGHEVAEFAQGESIAKLEQCVDETDVLVVPRPCEPKIIQLMEELKKTGVKIIVDHDDNMFQVSPLSPHYEAFGTENVDFKLSSGEIMTVWKDGEKNFNIAKNKERLSNFQAALVIADVVTVTQPILAEVYEEWNENVKVLPNCVDMGLWQRLPLKPHEGLRIGWAGGHSHYEDWSLLENVLPEIMKKYPQLKLVIMGQKFNGTLKRCPQDRIEHHHWVHTEAYPYKMATLDLDLAIIPLVDNKFNRCKSNIKWVEMGALQIPAVTSLVSPYKEWHNGKNGVFVENKADSWIEGISYMIENQKEREEMGRQAYQTVKDNFDIWSQCHLWAEAYK